MLSYLTWSPTSDTGLKGRLSLTQLLNFFCPIGFYFICWLRKKNKRTALDVSHRRYFSNKRNLFKCFITHSIKLLRLPHLTVHCIQLNTDTCIENVHSTEQPARTSAHKNDGVTLKTGAFIKFTVKIFTLSARSHNYCPNLILKIMNCFLAASMHINIFLKGQKGHSLSTVKWRYEKVISVCPGQYSHISIYAVGLGP